MRTRIAPTPSGFLHIGNAFNFLLTEKLARRCGGQLLLRIDDLDTPRIREEYVANIFESLAWLGLARDEGPRDAEELAHGYSQSLRLPDYEKMMAQLVQSGMVFACTCSRKELAQSSKNGQYDGACIHKKIPLDAPDVAWRVQTPQEMNPIIFEDKIAGRQQINLWEEQRHFIIRRRDGLPAYHVASVCDDVLYGIDAIVRGHDLLSSTGAQLYLANLQGATGFISAGFYHHPLITDNDGGKLSKSAGSTSLKALRAAGLSAAQLRAQFEKWAQNFF